MNASTHRRVLIEIIENEKSAEAARKLNAKLAEIKEWGSKEAVEKSATDVSNKFIAFTGTMVRLSDEMEELDFSDEEAVSRITDEIAKLEINKEKFEKKIFPILSQHKDELSQSSKAEYFTEKFLASLVNSVGLLKENFELLRAEKQQEIAFPVFDDASPVSDVSQDHSSSDSSPERRERRLSFG